MANEYKIILASSSPRRREIMDQIGAKYTVIPSTKEEKIEDIAPCELVKKLSLMKATDVAENAAPLSVIIGADTVVAFDGKILGKPKDSEDAFRMLSSFAGGFHYVHTGICIIIKNSARASENKIISYSVSTRVKVTPMTEHEIRSYIKSGEPSDKAGAYAIQGLFAPFIESIEGDYYNIVGFPISSVYHTLLDEGIDLLK